MNGLTIFESNMPFTLIIDIQRSERQTASGLAKAPKSIFLLGSYDIVAAFIGVVGHLLTKELSAVVKGGSDSFPNNGRELLYIFTFFMRQLTNTLAI